MMYSKHRRSRFVVVFYYPDADRLESEPFLDQMTAMEKMERSFSDHMNHNNAESTRKVLRVIKHKTDRSIFQYELSEAATVDSEAPSGRSWMSCLCSTPTTEETPNGLENEGFDEEMVRFTSEGNTREKSAWMESLNDQYLVFCYRPYYSHAELLIGDDAYSVRWGGPIRKVTRKPYHNQSMYYSFVSLNLPEESVALATSVLGEMIRSGAGFNKMGLLVNHLMSGTLGKLYGLAYGGPYESENKMFCSEMISRVLCILGVFSSKTSKPSRGEHSRYADDESDYQGGPFWIDETGSGVAVINALMTPNDIFLALMLKKELLCWGSLCDDSPAPGKSKNPFASLSGRDLIDAITVMTSFPTYDKVIEGTDYVDIGREGDGDASGEASIEIYLI